MRDRPPELRDVGVVHEPGDRAARAARQHRRVREKGVHAAEAARRAGGAAPPGSPRREADTALEGSSGLHRRADGWAVQAGALSLLARPLRPCCRAPLHVRYHRVTERRHAMKKPVRHLGLAVLAALIGAAAMVRAQAPGTLTDDQRKLRWDTEREL